jgi:hypothetical protein
MLILLLHGTLDHHDAIAVVVFALTLALGSFLSSLRRKQRGAGTDPTPPHPPPGPARDPAGEGEEAHNPRKA